MKRYGQMRPEVQRQALLAVAMHDIQVPVNQIVNQAERAVESKRPN